MFMRRKKKIILKKGGKIMLQVTARVFDNNQLVGYQISDGQQTQLFTRQQAWVFAKNKQLLNVTATGDETNPGLSGTHGFELKRLPEIKWKEPSSVKTSQKCTFNTQDLAAALIRNVLAGGSTAYDREGRTELCRQQLRDDVKNGVVNANTARSLSPHIHILEGLTNGAMGLVGWRIKYTGSQPLRITRMTSTPEHSTSEVILQPESNMCLSKAELTILASKPEIGCTFSNGKLVRSIGYVKPEVDMYNEISSYKILTNVEYAEDKVPVQKFVDDSTINTYFTPVNPAQAAQQKAAQAQQTQKSIQQKGLFGAFKR